MPQRHRIHAAILFLVLALSLIAPSNPQHVGAEEAVAGDSSAQSVLPDELIVKFKDAPRSTISTLHHALGVEPSARAERARFEVVPVPAGESLDALIEEYLASDLVEYAEPNYPVYIAWAPDDELYWRQWHFDQVNAEAAWEIIGGGSPDIVVAVLDTGVAYENYGRFVQAPDLAETSFIPGWDFINRDAHANDDHRHGTHVAGTIAQSTNNVIGVAGLAFGVTIMPVKVLGSGGSGSISTVADGIYYAVDNGARVINMSLSADNPSTTLLKAVDYALEKGVVVVAAAGNYAMSGNGAQYPAAYDFVIAVGATRYDRMRSYYSNYGDYVDIVAPGGDTSVDQNRDGYSDGVLQQTIRGSSSVDSFDYYYMQGTSMASPHVAAAAALLLSLNPSLTPQEVRSILQSTAFDLGQPGKDPHYGHGLLDVAAAVDRAAPVFTARPRRFESSVPSGSVRSESFSLVNRSDSPVSYSISTCELDADGVQGTEAAWLQIGPAGGTLNPGESSNHLLTVDAAALLPGEYRAQVVIEGNPAAEYPVFLFVNLTVTPGLPIVVTGQVTDISETFAVAGGAISNVGFEDCDAVGVCWGVTPMPTVDDKADDEGHFGEGDFGPFQMEGLLPGTVYFVRAYAHNQLGYGYGQAVSFTTLPRSPTNLEVVDRGPYNISLEWERGAGADWTHVRVKQGSFPADREDGEPVYDGPDSSYVCGPLDPGKTYYFKAWSRTIDSNGDPVWSDAWTELNDSTTEGDSLDSLELELHAGWNMVSVPLYLVGFDELTRVFPGALAAYSWNGTTYHSATRIEPGIGYWVAVPESASGPLVIRGLPSGVQSCDLFPGWNLVGSLSAAESASLADLNVIGASGTETLDLGHVYWWDGTSYVTPAEIEPGMAYWLAASAECSVTLEMP